MTHWYIVQIAGLALGFLAVSFSPRLNASAFSTQHGVTTRQSTPTSRFVTDTIPGDEEINETGILKQVDDTGYPMAVLTVEFPKQKLTEQFTINLNEVRNVQMATLSDQIGKPIALRYTTEQTNTLLDIEVGGRFLLDADINALKGTTSKVTGELGADEVTTGDVPGLITITATDGEVTEFPFFVTSELLEVNGTTVTAFYEERTTNTVKAITLIK